MGVRATLAFGVGAASHVLDAAGHLPECPIGPERKDAHRPRPIVGDQQEAAIEGQAQVARALPARRHCAQPREVAGGEVTAEGRNAAGGRARAGPIGERSDLVHGVEVLAVAAQRKVGGVVRHGKPAKRTDYTCVVPARKDPFRATCNMGQAFGVGPDDQLVRHPHLHRTSLRSGQSGLAGLVCSVHVSRRPCRTRGDTPAA